MAELQLALQEDPNQPLANYYMADMLTDQKEYQLAINHLRITIPVYPNLKQAYFLLGKCYAGTGDSKQALEAFNKVIELDPDYKEAHYQLYGLYARIGEKAKSEEQLRIFEKLVKEGQDRDKKLLNESLQKRKEAENQN